MAKTQQQEQFIAFFDNSEHEALQRIADSHNLPLALHYVADLAAKELLIRPTKWQLTSLLVI